MKIEVWSDYICPFCYIGKRYLEHAIENFEHKESIVIEYKSYELNPEAKPSRGMTIHELLADKYNMSVAKAKEMNEKLRIQAEEVGLIYNFESMQHTNTFDAHRLAKMAAKEGKGSEMVELLLRAYFTEGQVISDHRTLLKLAREVGIDNEKAEATLQSCKFTSYVRDDEEQARQIGVQGVPFFVFNETYSVSGAQPPEVFTEVLHEIWKEEHKDPTLKSFTPKNSETSFCTDEGCRIDENW